MGRLVQGRGAGRDRGMGGQRGGDAQRDPGGPCGGVPRVVHTSTCAINSDTDGRTVDEEYRHIGPHLTTYDETKAQAHDVAVAAAASHETPEVVIVMPGGIYGPGDTSSVGNCSRRSRPGAGRWSRLDCAWSKPTSMTSPPVTCRRWRRAPGRGLHAGGERTDLASMAEEMAQITGGRRPIVMPGPLLPVAEKVFDVAGRVPPLPPQFSGEAMRSARSSYLGTSIKARRELGVELSRDAPGFRRYGRGRGLDLIVSRMPRSDPATASPASEPHRRPH